MEKRGEVATLLLLISAGVVLLGAALGIKDATTPQPNPLNSTAQQSSCTFKSTATLKNESGNVLPITTNGNDITIHYKLTSTNGKTLEGDNQLINGTIIQNTTLANDMIGAKVDLSLKYNNQDYEVQGAFCNENPPETDRHSSTAACNEWYGDRTRNAVQQTLRCGKTIEWGYIVKPLKPIAVPTTCPFHSTVSLKDENGQVLPINSVNNDIAVHHSFRTSDGRLNEGDRPFVNGIHIEKDGLRPQDIGSVVNLTLKYNKADYEVKGAFCNETPSESDRHSSTATCNEWYGDANQNGVQQTLRCGKTIEWGYIVKSLKPTPTPTTMPPTRIRMKLQQNNMGSNYYQCTVNNDSDTEKTSVGGLTRNGNIKCHGEYTKSTDTLRVYFRIPQGSDLDAGMRLTLNTMRCRNYDPNKECWDRAFPEWALTGENFAMSRGSTMECFWKHPFTSTDRNDVTCKKGSETVAYPTAPPANIATGTIDSVKLEYSYQTKGIINTPGEPQKEGTVTKNDSIYATRNIDGCQLGNSSPDSKCPPGLTCKYTKDANGVINGVSISGNKKTQFISAAWFKGCACNADQAMPGRGICDPVMYRSIPSQSEHQMHNNFCFAPNNQETKITCMFDGNRCNVSEGSISDGICIANTQPQPTSAPAENSCPGKQEKAAPNKCNAACCTPGMDNQCPTGEACNISNGDCLGGSSCGPAADSVCKVAGQSCGPVHYREDCGNGGTRWCHKYQSTCSGVGDASMCKWDVPPGNKPSCCDVCTDGSRDNNTCSGGGDNTGPQPTVPGGQSPITDKGVVTGKLGVNGTLPDNRSLRITLCSGTDCSRTYYFKDGDTYRFPDVPYGPVSLLVSNYVYDADGVQKEYDQNMKVTGCLGETVNFGLTCRVNLHSQIGEQNLQINITNLTTSPNQTTSIPVVIRTNYTDPAYKTPSIYFFSSPPNKVNMIGWPNNNSTVFREITEVVVDQKVSVYATDTGLEQRIKVTQCPGSIVNDACSFTVSQTPSLNQVEFLAEGSVVPTSTPIPTPAPLDLPQDGPMPTYPQACNGTGPSSGTELSLTPNSNGKYPVTFSWAPITGAVKYALRINTICLGQPGGTQSSGARYTTTSSSYTDIMNGCAFDAWPRDVSWEVDVSMDGVRYQKCSNFNTFSFRDVRSPTPLPAAMCKNTECRWPQTNKCYPLNQTIAVCDKKTVQCPSGIFDATFYRLPLSDMCTRSSGACLPEGTPCTQLPTSPSSMQAAVISDINNDGVVGVNDFFTAIRSFGSIVKIKGQTVKVDATYMSTILSNLGKKAN